MKSFKIALEVMAFLMIIAMDFMVSSHVEATKTETDTFTADAAFYGINLNTESSQVTQNVTVPDPEDTDDAFFWGIPQPK